MDNLYRVSFTTSGMRRKVRTVTAEQKDYLLRATHAGIRVTSYRKATDAEAKRGPYQGNVYV